MTDIHCHLTHFSNSIEKKEVVRRAKYNNIKIVDCITEPDLWNNVLNKEVLYSVGIHPKLVENKDYSKEYILMEKISNQLVAIGEIGYDKTNKEKKKQQEVFFNQISIAKKKKLPILIHCNKRYDKLYKDLKNLQLKIPVIIHRYSGGDGLVDSFIKIGCYLSYSIDILSNKKIRSSFEKTPIDKILVETDAPYLKYKDKIFTSSDIPYLICEMSKIKKFERLNEKIEDNCKNIFNYKSSK